MDNLDLKLLLLSGEGIHVSDEIGILKPLTLRQIAVKKYSKYAEALNIILMDIKDFINVEDNELKTINMFDLLVLFGDVKMRNAVQECIEFFFDRKVMFLEETNIFVVEEDSNNEVALISRENFDEFREAVKLQYNLKDYKSITEESDKVKSFREKLEKKRMEVNRIKNAGSDDGMMDLGDIISAVSTKSNALNKNTIFDLTVYQLYDELKRLELIEQYDISIKSMMAGAKNVKVKHWSSRLEQ